MGSGVFLSPPFMFSPRESTPAVAAALFRPQSCPEGAGCLRPGVAILGKACWSFPCQPDMSPLGVVPG